MTSCSRANIIKIEICLQLEERTNKSQHTRIKVKQMQPRVNLLELSDYEKAEFLEQTKAYIQQLKAEAKFYRDFADSCKVEGPPQTSNKSAERGRKRFSQVFAWLSALH